MQPFRDDHQLPVSWVGEEQAKSRNNEDGGGADDHFEPTKRPGGQLNHSAHSSFVVEVAGVFDELAGF